MKIEKKKKRTDRKRNFLVATMNRFYLQQYYYQLNCFLTNPHLKSTKKKIHKIKTKFLHFLPFKSSFCASFLNI